MQARLKQQPFGRFCSPSKQGSCLGVLKGRHGSRPHLSFSTRLFLEGGSKTALTRFQQLNCPLREGSGPACSGILCYPRPERREPAMERALSEEQLAEFDVEYVD